MALKQAQIFKDFYIAANADNTGVTFSMNAPLTVSVKNDNFAQQVQILDNADTTDLFDYKYITFDGHAVFEITDCIKNDKYTTLFVQYLSNIKFDAVDSNFRVDAVSAHTLQRLGLDINAFLQVLGNNVVIDSDDVMTISHASQQPFFFAVKLRFSQIPNNLNCYFNLDGSITASASVQRGSRRSRLYVQSFPESGQTPTAKTDFTQFDNAVTAILPIPTRSTMSLKWLDTTISCDISSLLIALNELISDLTLTAEITILTGNSLIAFSAYRLGGSQTIQPLTVAQDATSQTITIPIQGSAASTPWGGFLRCTDNAQGSAYNQRHPCFVTEMNTGGGGQADWSGFWECYNFFRLYIDGITNTRALLSMTLLNNTIDISQLRNNYVLIRRQSQSLRVYVDYDRNVFEDVQTTFEFAKNAYSNFDAYQKSNIELTNRQAFNALRQQQEQARDLQTVDTAFAAANTVMNSVSSFASGNIAGGVTGLLGGAANIAQQEIKFNMQQQNQTANAKLAAAQQLEKARSTIVPSSELHGSLSFLDAFVSRLSDNGNAALYSISSIRLNGLQMACVERYAFDNLITDKITNVSQIVKPAWQTLHNYFIVKIENRSAINNRKGLIIFAEVRS